jgi:PGF-pre-PGF domain-containing protein
MRSRRHRAGKIASKTSGSRKRLVASAGVTGAIILMLLFASPVSALTIDITEPNPKLLGQAISFSVTITIEDGELLPIENINLEIYKSDNISYHLICRNLPLIATTKTYSTMGGNVKVEAKPAAGWGYGYGYGYVEWENWGYYFGYGYGYGHGPGPTSITYDVTWYSPSTWPAGDYTIKVTVIADGQTFVKTRTDALEAPVPIPDNIIESSSTVDTPSITSGVPENVPVENTNITGLTITTNENVENVRITVQQLTGKPPNIAIGAPGTVYQYFNITVENLWDAQIDNVIIRFRVEKSWIAQNGIDIQTITLSRYDPLAGAWTSLPATFLSEDSTYAYFSVVSPGLSVFGISGSAAPTPTPTPTTTTTPPPTTTTPTPTTTPVPPTPFPSELAVLIVGAVIIVIIVILGLLKLPPFRKPR